MASERREWDYCVIPLGEILASTGKALEDTFHNLHTADFSDSQKKTFNYMGKSVSTSGTLKEEILQISEPYKKKIVLKLYFICCNPVYATVT